jgi:hypothetical protein
LLLDACVDEILRFVEEKDLQPELCEAILSCIPDSAVEKIAKAMVERLAVQGLEMGKIMTCQGVERKQFFQAVFRKLIIKNATWKHAFTQSFLLRTMFPMNQMVFVLKTIAQVEGNDKREE